MQGGMLGSILFIDYVNEAFHLVNLQVTFLCAKLMFLKCKNIIFSETDI